GLIEMGAGDLELSRGLLEEGLSLLTPGEHARRGMLLHNLGQLADAQGSPEQARSHYEEALRHRRLAGDMRGEAETLANLGTMAEARGSFPDADRLYRGSLGLFRTLRDRAGMAVTLNNIAEVAEQIGDLDTAAVLYPEAERLFRDLGSPHASV